MIVRISAVALLVLAVGVVLGCPPASAQSSGDQMDSAVLRANDAVRITVWRNPELSGEFMIGTDGRIRHPIYRQVTVGGVPVSEIEERVHAFLVQFEADPQFVVEPLFSVAVTGQVREPNLYTLPPGTSVLQAVAVAGGATEDGRLDRVLLHRNGSRTELDLTAQEADRNRSVLSGDQIEVTRKGPNILQAYIGPVASLLAAVATIINLSR